MWDFVTGEADRGPGIAIPSSICQVPGYEVLAISAPRSISQELWCGRHRYRCENERLECACATASSQVDMCS